MKIKKFNTLYDYLEKNESHEQYVLLPVINKYMTIY